MARPSGAALRVTAVPASSGRAGVTPAAKILLAAHPSSATWCPGERNRRGGRSCGRVLRSRPGSTPRTGDRARSARSCVSGCRRSSTASWSGAVRGPKSPWRGCRCGRLPRCPDTGHSENHRVVTSLPLGAGGVALDRERAVAKAPEAPVDAPLYPKGELNRQRIPARKNVCLEVDHPTELHPPQEEGTPRKAPQTARETPGSVLLSSIPPLSVGRSTARAMHGRIAESSAHGATAESTSGFCTKMAPSVDGWAGAHL